MVDDWDTVWMAVAHQVARRSSCGLSRVGAVIADSQQRIVATGYNGPPSGWPGACTDVGNDGCPRFQRRERNDSFTNCISVHAEANALLFCDLRDRRGGTIYATRACCIECSKLIANSGLARVVMVELEDDVHRDPWKGQTFMRGSGLEVVVCQT